MAYMDPMGYRFKYHKPKLLKLLFIMSLKANLAIVNGAPLCRVCTVNSWIQSSTTKIVSSESHIIFHQVVHSS